MRSIVIGRDGLRAGWRIAVFALIFALLAVAFSIVAGAIFWISAHVSIRAAAGTAQTGQVSPALLALSDGPPLTAALVAAWVMSRIERRRMGAYGLPSSQAFRATFWEGALVGFVAISLVLAVIYALGGLRVSGSHATSGTRLADGFTWAVAFILGGLNEEFLFRGYVQFTLGRGIGFGFAAALTSIAFAAAHSRNHGETITGLVSVLAFALMFNYVLWRSGSLWFGAGLHAAWDWGQTYFYGVPDSGLVTSHTLLLTTFRGPAWETGSTAGPEGSIFAFAALGAIAAYATARFPRKPHNARGEPAAVVSHPA